MNHLSIRCWSCCCCSTSFLVGTSRLRTRDQRRRPCRASCWGWCRCSSTATSTTATVARGRGRGACSRGWSSRGSCTRPCATPPSSREVEPFIGFVPSLLVAAAGHGGWPLMFSRTLPLVEEHRGSLLRADLLRHDDDRLSHPHHPAQGHHPGGRLPGDGERHLRHGLDSCWRRCRSWSRWACCSTCSSAIFVMGIIIHHISREYASLDTARLSALKE